MAREPFCREAREVLRELGGREEGLTSEEAVERLRESGENRIFEREGKGPVSVFLSQFKDLLVLILALAAAISLASGNAESALVIIAVLVLNATLGTVEHLKAKKSLDALRAMSAPVAKVLRDGVRAEVPAASVVPGDVLVLEAGDLVVADARLLECHALRVDESSLTGESHAVEKRVEPLSESRVPLGDRANMVYSSSLVTYGRATAVVTATGMGTEVGRIAELMNATVQRKTPLQRSLDDFSKKLAAGVLAVCALVFLLSVLRSHMAVVDSLLFAVALAVAAIPEALGSIVTIVLAMGTQKMARQNAIVKDLKAVESLGSVGVVCTDKTGTLTQNRMTVMRCWTREGAFDADDALEKSPLSRRMATIGLLASDATTDDRAATEVGDPTEVALLNWAAKAGLREEDLRRDLPRLSELAFDSDRKMMSTLHEVDGVSTMLTKGAPDALVERAAMIATPSGSAAFDGSVRAEVLERVEAFSSQGLRVLAFAERPLEATVLDFEDEGDMTFVGLVAMMDPPREETPRAVADAARAGVRTVMITGDHKATACAVARSVGIMGEGDEALEGVELDGMDDVELEAAAGRTAVYARVSPEHKIRIVGAWQRLGCVVAMTGDGVNDAPALKRADVGIAMGVTGTEVSKDAASMVLADDNFATIVRAIVNGRSVYANIKGAIHFLLSGNMAGIVSVFVASLAGLPLPFQAVHLLFVNLLTDSLPAIALGLEPARDGLLDESPRDPKASILDARLLRKVAVHGCLIAAASMASFLLGLEAGAAAGSTMAFATLSLARLFHGFNCRADESLARLGAFGNPYVPLALLAGTVLLAAVLFVPALQGPFMVEPLSVGQTAQAALLAFAPTVLIQGSRMVRGR